MCLKFMVFGVTKETRWNVCFGKNQTQSLVEIELDPPKTGSILPKSIENVTICCSNFGLLSDNQNPYFGRNRNFTETTNLTRYRNRKFSLSLPKNEPLNSSEKQSESHTQKMYIASIISYFLISQAIPEINSWQLAN